MKKLLVTLIALGGFVAFAAHRWPLPASDVPPVRDDYPTVLMEFGQLAEIVSVAGTVQPVETYALGADVPGRIARVFVEAGQAVKQYEPLAQLDDRIPQLRAQQAKLAFEAASIEIERAAAARDLAKLTLGDGAPVQLRLAEAGQKAAAVKLRESQLAQALAEQAIEQTVIRSPAAGVVIDRQAQPGQQVGGAMGGPLFVVASDLATLQLVAQVPESDLGKVRIGQVARITFNAFPDDPDVEGRVAKIAPAAVHQPGAVVFAVQVSTPSNSGKLRPGLPATVELVARQRDGVWKLPLAAQNVSVDDKALSPTAKAKLDRWAGRVDRAEWQRVWTLGDDHRPWPLFLRTGGLQDDRCVDVLTWDSDEIAPKEPPRLITGPPPGAKVAAMKFF